ncbi:MAG: hypothetical protein ACXVAX_08425, partial [Pseudobdellovibrio sp.]
VKTRKRDIELLSAQSALLKLKLKTRVRSKCNEIRNTLHNQPLLLELLNFKLFELSGLVFGDTPDFAVLVNGLIYVNEVITTHNKWMNHNPETDMVVLKSHLSFLNLTQIENYTNLCKNDKATIQLIFKIIEVNKQLVKKIPAYHRLLKRSGAKNSAKTLLPNTYFENMFILSNIIQKQ